jgi:eukaryotic-like serine/threonine-protein kinase
MEQLGRYRLFHELGAGGFASVYKAEMVSPEGFRSLVAVKRLHPHLTRSEVGIVESLRAEAAACSRIHHHNVVQVYELSSEPDDRGGLQWFMVMELVEGASLEELPVMAAKRGAGLPAGVVLYLLTQVAEGLHHVHTLTDENGQPAGLIHRDLKPSNVLVRHDGVAKILDFGIAKSLYEGGPQTATGITRGTAAYMAPEQAFAKSLTPKADQFAFGALLFFLVIGEQLVKAESLAAELLFVVNTPADYRVDEVDARVPGLGAIFQRMREPRLEDRYGSMAEVLADLQRLQESVVDPVDPESYLAVLLSDPEARVSPREMMLFRRQLPGDGGDAALTLDQLGPQTLDRDGRRVPAATAAASWGMETTPSGNALDGARPGPTTPSQPALALEEDTLGPDHPARLTAELPGIGPGAPGDAGHTAELPELITDEQPALDSGDLPRARMEDAVSSRSTEGIVAPVEPTSSGQVPGMPHALDSSPATPALRATSAPPARAQRSWGWLLLVPLLLGVVGLVLLALVSLLRNTPGPDEVGGGEMVVIGDEEPELLGWSDPEDIVVESEEERAARRDRKGRDSKDRDRKSRDRKERDADRGESDDPLAVEVGADGGGEPGDDPGEETEADEASDGGGVVAAAPTETGVLKLNAYPAAKVWVDGKSVGTTLETAQGIRLAVGKHRIRLERSTDGHEASFNVTIKAKKVLSVPFEWEE